MTSLSSILSRFLFPEFCVGCHREGAFLCASCAKNFALAPDALCPDCVKTPPVYDAHRALFVFGEGVQKIVHELKYGDGFWVARFCAERIAAVAGVFSECDAVVPIPLHSRRLIARGYNQSALLAKVWASHLGLAMHDGLLVRAKETPTQTGLDKKARAENLMDAFAVMAPAAVYGKKILLVDDVHTTGATLNAAAAALKKAGAAKVCATTLASVGLQSAVSINQQLGSHEQPKALAARR